MSWSVPPIAAEVQLEGRVVEQLRAEVRDGDEVLYRGTVFLTTFEIGGETSWCGVLLAPVGSFQPSRPVLSLHLENGRSAHIAIALSPTSTGMLDKIFFEVRGAWRETAG